MWQNMTAAYHTVGMSDPVGHENNQCTECAWAFNGTNVLMAGPGELHINGGSVDSALTAGINQRQRHHLCKQRALGESGEPIQPALHDRCRTIVPEWRLDPGRRQRWNDERYDENSVLAIPALPKCEVVARASIVVIGTSCSPSGLSSVWGTGVAGVKYAAANAVNFKVCNNTQGKHHARGGDRKYVLRPTRRCHPRIPDHRHGRPISCQKVRAGTAKYQA